MYECTSGDDDAADFRSSGGDFTQSRYSEASINGTEWCGDRDRSNCKERRQCCL